MENPDPSKIKLCQLLDSRQMAVASWPAECRAHHPWRPGTVTITWEPCDCPAAREARGGHVKVKCNAPRCEETWWALLHRQPGLCQRRSKIDPLAPLGFEGDDMGQYSGDGDSISSAREHIRARG